MEAIFKPAKVFFKAEPISIDNAVFKMHYRLTFLVLVTASLYITSRMYTTSSIMCSHGYLSDNFATKIEDQYCLTHYTHSTFGSTTIVHSEYQWVSTLLFLQALTFYFPRLIWKMIENGRTKIIIQNVNHPLLLDDDRKYQISKISQYWKNYRGTHFSLAMTFLICETLNMFNVIAQITITNWFLGGKFVSIGTNLLKMDIEPLLQMFPTVAKCNLPSYDFSGVLKITDLFCLLPHNPVHKYVYIAAWFWYSFLASLTSLYTFYKITTFFLLTTQVQTITNISTNQKKNVLILLKKTDQTYLQKIGDTFMIKLILKNIKNNVVIQETIDSMLLLDNSKDV